MVEIKTTKSGVHNSFFTVKSVKAKEVLSFENHNLINTFYWLDMKVFWQNSWLSRGSFWYDLFTQVKKDVFSSSNLWNNAWFVTAFVWFQHLFHCPHFSNRSYFVRQRWNKQIRTEIRFFGIKGQFLGFHAAFPVCLRTKLCCVYDVRHLSLAGNQCLSAAASTEEECWQQGRKHGLQVVRGYAHLYLPPTPPSPLPS